jgi:hypothetical protein
MGNVTYTLHGARIPECEADGPRLKHDRDAVDVVGAALSERANLVVIPVSRLGDEFFVLKTRVAGEIIQKFVNYGLRLVIVGDIARHVAESDALRDFVYETNRGKQVWFLAGKAELKARLASA